MSYVIGAPCIDRMDRTCMDECPVDCIYVGARKLYINPAECIDCGACEPVCPVEAIRKDTTAEIAEPFDFAQDSQTFFDTPLPGRPAAIGSPGGARDFGEVGVDTERVSTYQATEAAR